MDRMARNLSIAACGLFIASLVLPVAEITIFDHPTLVLGWEAAVSSVGLGAADVPHAGMRLLAAAAIGNVVFVLAPWMVLKARGRTASLIYMVGVAAGLLLAIAVPLVRDDFAALHGGYFVWIGAFFLLLGAVGLRIGTRTMHGYETR